MAGGETDKPMMKFKHQIAGFASLFAAACGQMPEVPGTSHDDTVEISAPIPLHAAEDRPAQIVVEKLTNIEWIIEDIGGRGIIDSSRVTIVLSEDGRISGRATCNNYSGSYDRDSEDFRTRDIAVTNRACVEALARQEAEFLRILRGASRTSTANDGSVVISNPSGESLIARRS